MPTDPTTVLVNHLITVHAARVAGLRAIGVSDGVIRRSRRNGLLVDLGHGVVGLAADPDPHRRDRVGAQVLHPASVFSHQTAAELHGFEGRDAKVHLTAPHGTRLKSEAVELHRTSWLPPDDRSTVGAQEATSPARTVCDLAASAASDEHYAWLVQEAIASRLSVEALLACHHDLSSQGRDGTARRRLVFDRLLGDEPAMGASELEAEFLRVTDAAGIVGLVVPFAPPWFDGTRGVVDAAIPAHRLIVELDGRRWHATLSRFDTDRARDRQAVEAGWRVLRFSWTDVMRRPDSVVASIRAVCILDQVA